MSGQEEVCQGNGRHGLINYAGKRMCWRDCLCQRILAFIIVSQERIRLAGWHSCSRKRNSSAKPVIAPEGSYIPEPLEQLTFLRSPLES